MGQNIPVIEKRLCWNQCKMQRLHLILDTGEEENWGGAIHQK